MRSALDQNDRTTAMLVWGGVLVGGPIVPLVILVAFGRNKAALARHHAFVSLAMWTVALAVWIPAFCWTFLFHGSIAIYWVGTAVLGVVVWSTSIVMFVKALKAPLALAPVLDSAR